MPPQYSDGAVSACYQLVLFVAASPALPVSRSSADGARRLAIASWLLGLLLLVAVVVVGLHLGEINQMVALLGGLRLPWLLAALVLQAATYACAAAIWQRVLTRAGQRQTVAGLMPLSLAKLFTDQAMPSVHGDKWAPYFEKLKSHLSVAYIKDADRAGHFVRFGEGDFGGTDYFTQLKRMNYRAPYSIHIEFDWSSKGKNKTRAALLASLQDSAAKLRQWVAKS